jgi:hypothetical protein
MSRHDAAAGKKEPRNIAGLFCVYMARPIFQGTMHGTDYPVKENT